MDRNVRRVEDLVDSLSAPEIMTKHEALDFLQELLDCISTKIEALEEEIG